MNLTNNHPVQSSCQLADAGDFIADYTAWLWGCGATCMRIEKNSGRIARALGYDICITIMPKHISLTLKDSATGSQATYQRQMVTCGINFDLNTRLSSLSWKIADRKLSYCQAKALFDKIISTTYSTTQLTVLLTSLANASFCRLFGGDAAAMLVVFAATFAGFELKHILLKARLDVRLVFMVLCVYLDCNRHRRATLRLGRHPGHSHSHKRALPHPGCALHQFGKRPHRPSLSVLAEPVYGRLRANGMPVYRHVCRTFAHGHKSRVVYGTLTSTKHS